jgi:hypothetical protein
MTVVAVVTFATPAFAATEYYIVREGSSGPCKVVESRPTKSTTVIVGGDKVYTTRSEVEKQMAVVCKSDHDWRLGRINTFGDHLGADADGLDRQQSASERLAENVDHLAMTRLILLLRACFLIPPAPTNSAVSSSCE